MPDDYSAILGAEFRDADLPLPPDAHQKLTTYCEELERWNRKINLTALSGVKLVRRLIVEPAWIAEELRIGGSLVDIGSGNGSPAIPIHICRQLDWMELVDARTRKAAFLRHLSAVLGLNIFVHRGLFEDVLVKLKTPDWFTLQAVAPTPKLINGLRRIAKPSTRVVWITNDASASRLYRGSDRCIVPRSTTAGVLLRL